MNIFINFETGEGVMMFFENKVLSPTMVEKWAKLNWPDVLEAYEVKDEELQYYLYEPMWMTDAKVDELLKQLQEYEAKLNSKKKQLYYDSRRSIERNHGVG